MRRILVFILLASLTLFLIPAEIPSPLRIVSIKLVLDVSGNCSPQRQGKALTSVLSEISSEFEQEFSIRFVVKEENGFEKWLSDPKADSIDSMLPHLQKFAAKGLNDVVIGLTCRKDIKGKKGLSLYEEGFVLVRWYANASFFKKVLKHEICHLFGATHVNNNDALMDRFLRGTNITPLHKKMILLHRDRDFKGSRFPLAEDKLATAAELYRKIAAINERSLGMRVNFIRGRKMQRAFSRMEDVYLRIAMVYRELKNYTKAIAACRKALRIDPKLYGAYDFIGIAYRRSGQIKKAIKNYHEALEINPSYKRIYYNLGIAYEENGDQELAISAYKKAADANPHFAGSWNNLGVIFLEKREFNEAVSYFRKAIAANPYYPKARVNLARVLAVQEEHKDAIEELEKSLELNPRLPEAHFLLGQLYFREGEIEKAKEAFKQAVKLNPSLKERVNQILGSAGR